MDAIYYERLASNGREWDSGCSIAICNIGKLWMMIDICQCPKMNGTVIGAAIGAEIRAAILSDTPITTVDSFHFLGITITQDLKPIIISIIKKVQQRMYSLRQLKKFSLPTWTMMQFNIAFIMIGCRLPSL